MVAHLTALAGARGLLHEWTTRTLRARYQQSVLGWLWAVIQPATQAVVFAVIFTRIVPVPTGDTPYLVFSYVATVPWAFLAASLTDMTNSLVENMTLVNKIYFPREVLPLAMMGARLVDFGVAALFFLPLAFYQQVPALSPALVWLPVVLAAQILLVTGLGLVGAALNVFVRDVRALLVLVLQLWFYASPILYPVDAVPERLRVYYALNPMVGIVEAYRAVLLHGTAPDTTFAIAAVIAAVVFAGGYRLFKAVERQFADIV